MANNLITYSSCPACGSDKITSAITCKDYTVSSEKFEIWQCAACTLRFTQHIPDAANIGPYYQSDNYISHSDDGDGLVYKLYKVARRYTLGSKRNIIHQSTKLVNGNLLDVGCGTGAFLNEMKKTGWKVTGIEPDSGAREKAFELYGIQPQNSEQFYKLIPGFYDAITMWHVLEHVHDLQGYMAQLKRLLAPGGRLFIAVPNYTSTDAKYYKEYWAAYDVPRHLYHFSPASMEKLARQHGFTIANIKPMRLDAFYISILSEQYKNGRGSMPKAFWEGLKCTLASAKNKTNASSLIYELVIK